MKRIIIFMFISFFFTNVAFSQINEKKLEEAIEKAEREYKAKQKKSTEPKSKAEQVKQRTEQAKTNRQTQQLQRQYDNNFRRQINSLNQTTAKDYMNPPLTKVNELGEPQQISTIVATPKMAKTNHSKGTTAFGNSGNIGTPSYSGNNYTGDRYNLKPAGFSNIQQPQYPRKTTEQIRGQYKPSRTMNQGVINTRQTHMPSKASMQRFTQQDNTQNVGAVQTQRTRGTQKTQQASNQQRNAQNISSMQMTQKKQVPVREQVDANRNAIINTSHGLHPNTGQNNSSRDLAMPDMAKPKKETNTKKMKAFALPSNEAPYLLDRDNKTPSKYKGAGRTIMQEYQLANKDRMNGYASFENRNEWENIYDVFDAGKVKTSSRVVRQTR